MQEELVKKKSKINVAIVHDWITGMRGGERVLEILYELFPTADIFTLLFNKGNISTNIEKMNIRTSFVQYLPFASRNYRSYLPLFPIAIENFNLKDYDLVISSSHCVAKGAKVNPKACHICYCYTPMRYAWLFFDEYFGSRNWFSKSLIKFFLWDLKRWDLSTNKRVDYFVAISENVKDRIKKFYNRSADVIYPPVETKRFKFSYANEDYYLIVSALVPYKRIDIAIEAFNELGLLLVIIGTGDCEIRLKKIAKDNIKFLGGQPDEVIEDYYAKCKALIFPGEEDFGIVPLEAQACGRPVIAYGKGGALETVVPINAENRKPQPEPTGIFFYEQTPKALAKAVRYFETVKSNFNKESIRQNVIRFDRESFKNGIKEFICEKFFLKTGRKLDA